MGKDVGVRARAEEGEQGEARCEDHPRFSRRPTAPSARHDARGREDPDGTEDRRRGPDRGVMGAVRDGGEGVAPGAGEEDQPEAEARPKFPAHRAHQNDARRRVAAQQRAACARDADRAHGRSRRRDARRAAGREESRREKAGEEEREKSRRLTRARPLVLFTDFGAADLYVGQAKAVLAACAPRSPVIDALHDAPAFGIAPAAHLLAALAAEYPLNAVFLAVVDPGVGSRRGAIVTEIDRRHFVGPDNGLLSILWQRARRRKCWRILWRPERLSASFHGRDLFAPVAAALATGRVPRGCLAPKARPDVLLPAADLGRIIYIDHYGNAVTGLRFTNARATLGLGRRVLPYARTFDEARGPFWYENSMGLVEIAAPRSSAARELRLKIGTRVTLR